MNCARFMLLLTILACALTAWAPVAAQQEIGEREEAAEEEGSPTGNREGEKKQESPGEPKKKKAQEKNSRVVMQDGTIILGRIDLEKFEIETDYGRLVVPREKVLKIRIGKNADKELKERIAKLIKQLGHQEFNLREKASKELASLGVLVLKEVREALKSKDPEIQDRARKLVKAIEETVPPDMEEVIDDDEVVTEKFTIRGTLLMDRLTIETRYGTITADKKEIKTIVVTMPPGVNKTIVVRGESCAGTGNMEDTGIEVNKGDKITIWAWGTISIGSWSISVGPDGNKGYSSHFKGIHAGALMGRIGKSGQVFMIGPSYSAYANRKGRLYLGIGVKPNYSPRGKFSVKVRIEKK